jgi:hypothetical protein
MNDTKRLIKEFYRIECEDIPHTREQSKWKSENKCGFLLGIIEFGLVSHREKLLELVSNQQFKDQEMNIINEMYQFYIYPCKQHTGTGKSESSCHTPETTSSHSSRQNSAEEIDYIPEEEKELTHYYLKKAVEKRDGVCLFCWNNRQCEGSLILAQKDIPFPYDEAWLFERTGLKQQHQVQNGLLLCVFCHKEFDALKRYVDVVNDKLIVKVVNETDDKNNEKYLEWKRIVRDLKISRQGREEDWLNIDKRQAVDSEGEMELFFLNNNNSRLPNRKALEFHKTACLIWRMAGGAESDEEYCPDDHDTNCVPSDTKSKSIQNWIFDSKVTLNTAID